VDGIIVPERDPVLFGWTMLELIRDDRRRKDLGEAARRKVEERYSIQKSVAAFEELFASLAR
jgi:glycosyltransferase involved in cell wall biosynthesis